MPTEMWIRRSRRSIAACARCRPKASYDAGSVELRARFRAEPPRQSSALPRLTTLAAASARHAVETTCMIAEPAGFGELLPRLRVQPPGPRSRALTEALKVAESP